MIVFLAAWLLPARTAAQALQLSLEDHTICAGGHEAVMTPEVSGGLPPYTFAWTPADGLSCVNCQFPGASPDTTTTYQLTVVDAAGNTATASSTVTVVPVLSLSLSSESDTVCAAAFVVINAALADGFDACTYKWQIATSATGPWQDMAAAWNDAFLYPATQGWAIGATTYYRCIATCALAPCLVVTSDPIALTVAALPAASLSPARAFVCQYEPLTLTAALSGGAGSCDLQWLSSANPDGPWTPVAGADGPMFEAPTDVLGSVYYTVQYGCAGFNCGAAVQGLPAKVTTILPPGIAITSAADTAVCVGATPALNAQTTGGDADCTLQWQRASSPDGPWADVPDAHTPNWAPPTQSPGLSFYRASYYCAADTLADDDVFRLRIGNVYNAGPGQPACMEVTVQQFTNVYNLSFSISFDTALLELAAIGHFGLPGLSMANFGAPLPNPGMGSYNAHTLTMSWSDPDFSGETLPDGAVLFTLCFTPRSAAVAGSSPVAFTQAIMPLIAQMHVFPKPAREFLSGTVYFGTSCFGAISGVVAVDVQPDPAVDLLPSLQTVCTGGQALLTASYSGGAGSCALHWFSAPAPDGPWTLIPGATATVYAPPVAELGVRYYSVIFDCTGGDCNEGLSNIAEVRVQEQIIGDEIVATLSACNTWQLSAPLPPTYFGPVQLLWTLPDGSQSTGFQLQAGLSGLYQLSVDIPGTQCQAVLSRFIDVEAASCAVVSGSVIYDTDNNCSPDAGEAGLANWMVRAIGAEGTFYSLADGAGQYSFSLPLGEYTVSALPPSASWAPCADAYAVILSEAGEQQLLDLPVQYAALCPELDVQLSAPLLRRCFASPYYIQVCNQGTETIPATEVTLSLDALLTYENAQYPPDDVDGQLITWTLDTLAPGQCRQFWVNVTVSCEAALGQAHCSTVTATPDLLCTPASASWSGASLVVSGECAGNAAVFRVRNAGLGALSAPANCIVIEDVVMLMQQPPAIDELNVGEERVFEFPANGATWFFSVEQAPGHPFSNRVTAAIEGCGLNQAGAFSTGLVNQLPLQPATPAAHTFCLPNVGAYDPNDKQAIPVGLGPDHFIAAGDRLQYKIRFQNTGTDTAFTVVVRDTLSPWLDPASLRPGPSSHNYRLSIEGERTLVFAFNNILLPDSTTNLAASQGFADFFIRVADMAPPGARIENSAAIYFDFNEPVITNTVFHTIHPGIFTGVSRPPQETSSDWRLMPNPVPAAAEAVWLISERAGEGAKTARLFDALGRSVGQVSFTGSACSLPVSGLRPGWYAIWIQDANGRSLGSARLVAH